MAQTRISMNRITHLHCEETQRDCDGLYERDNIWTPREGMTGRELWTYAATSRVDCTWNYSQKVERTVDEDGLPVMEYFAHTDEGFIHEMIRGCDDEDCDPNARRYRDHTAESMGY